MGVALHSSAEREGQWIQDWGKGPDSGFRIRGGLEWGMSIGFRIEGGVKSRVAVREPEPGFRCVGQIWVRGP